MDEMKDFQIKKTQPFESSLISFCKEYQLDFHKMYFTYLQTAFEPKDTPEKVFHP